jgi:hypothetical protein
MTSQSYSLRCDDCGCAPRRPAIDLGLLVFCARCAPRHGMFPGEHGETRSYDEWRRLAADRQRAAVN